MEHGIFSPAQLVGYLAFVLGVTAFLQKTDWKLKSFNAAESLAYFFHFLLLGNPSAVVSAIISSVRSLLSIKIRSAPLAVFFIVLNIVLGVAFCTNPWGLFAILGTCLATWAALTMEGVPMRVLFLMSTFCWLTNNIASGSIGGTVLETFIALANGTTIVRMLRMQRQAKRC
jgi:hypothetical protein